MKIWHSLYQRVSTFGIIAYSYQEFRVGKKSKKDVILFEQDVKNNLLNLQKDLVEKTYQPGPYTEFCVKDPKLRQIHKATVVDRVVHHIVSRELEAIFEPTFIAHSFSCRKNKGTHKGVLALHRMALKVSRNNTRVCWVLKMDVSKFFASVNQKVLFRILAKKVGDEDFLDLLQKIICSFYSDRTDDLINKKGIPIGNLTSQFFSNIYLNELDQFVKHKLKIKYYVRYADDFCFLSDDRGYILSLIEPVREFLKNELDLDLHPKKIILRKLRSGVDFLGYIIFPDYILPRTSTKRRLIKKIKGKIKQYKAGEITEESLRQTIQSYMGYLSHAKAYKLKEELENLIWFWLTE